MNVPNLEEIFRCAQNEGLIKDSSSCYISNKIWFCDGPSWARLCHHVIKLLGTDLTITSYSLTHPSLSSGTPH